MPGHHHRKRKCSMTLCAEHCLIFHRIFILASRVFIDEILPLASYSYYIFSKYKEGRVEEDHIHLNLSYSLSPPYSCASTIFDPSTWPVSLDQTNKWPFPPGKWRSFLWMSPYVKPEMKGRSGWWGSHATQPFIFLVTTLLLFIDNFWPSPWAVFLNQTNKWPFTPGKLRRYLWIAPYVKPEMKGRPGGRGSHATQPFTRQTAFKAKETCNLNKFNLVSFKKRLHFFSALCFLNPGFLGF